MRTVKHAILALAFLGLRTEASSADGALGNSARLNDRRLETKVTLPAGVYYVPELLDRLTLKSGVVLLSRTPRNHGSDRLVVRFNDAPLIDVLNGIWASLSYKNAEWMWEQRAAENGYSYMLSPPTPPDRFTNGLNQWMEDRFSAEIEILLEALHLKTEERLDFLQSKLGPLFPGESRLIERMPEDWVRWKGLSIFEKTVPQQERELVLRGQKQLRIPYDKLPDEAKEFAQYQWRGGPVRITGQDGSVELVHRPAYLQIECIRGGSITPPTLMIGFQYTGSAAYAGGPPLQRVFDRMLRNRWILDGESIESHLTSSMLKKQHGDAASDSNVRRGFAERLRVFASECPVSTVARLPSPENWNPITVDDAMRVNTRTIKRSGEGFDLSTIKGYLESLAANGVMHKWRGPMLLLSPIDWMLPEEQRARIPWEEVKRLRARAKDSGGFVPFREALLTLAKANREQIPLLVLELPELTNLTRLYPLLKLIGENRLAPNALIGESGLPLDDGVKAALQPFHFPEISEAVAFYVREAESTIPIPGFDKGRMITFGYFLPNRVRRPLVDVPRLPNRFPLNSAR